VVNTGTEIANKRFKIRAKYHAKPSIILKDIFSVSNNETITFPIHHKKDLNKLGDKTTPNPSESKPNYLIYPIGLLFIGITCAIFYLITKCFWRIVGHSGKKTKVIQLDYTKEPESHQEKKAPEPSE